MNLAVPEKWNSLAKRLRWVLANRRGVIDNAEDWIRKANAVNGSKISRQFLASAMSRDESMRLDYAAMLTDVPGLNIDLYWLATGRGDPAAGVRGTADPWHERTRGAELAMRNFGVKYEVIEAVRRDPRWNKPEHREKRATWWKNRFLEASHAQLRLVELGEHVDATAPDERDHGS